MYRILSKISLFSFPRRSRIHPRNASSRRRLPHDAIAGNSPASFSSPPLRRECSLLTRAILARPAKDPVTAIAGKCGPGPDRGGGIKTPLRSLLKKPDTGSAARRFMRRRRDGFVGTGLRACPALHGCPSSGQARRPVPTANNLEGRTGLFQQPRQGGIGGVPLQRTGSCACPRSRPVPTAHRNPMKSRSTDSPARAASRRSAT